MINNHWRRGPFLINYENELETFCCCLSFTLSAAGCFSPSQPDLSEAFSAPTVSTSTALTP